MWLSYSLKYLIIEKECKCVSTNIKSTNPELNNILVDAYCAPWYRESNNFDWCFLEGGLNASSCQGAVKSTSHELYWSKHSSICEGKGDLLLFIKNDL